MRVNKEENIENILIVGGNGFIGRNFIKHVSPPKTKRNFDFYSKKLQKRVISPSHRELDILNRKQLRKIFNIFSPEIVINFAAFRNANTAEEQRGDKNGSAWRTNVEGVRNLSKMCKEHGSFLIHISTDMVFSGFSDKPGPYSEEDTPEIRLDNLSWYGWTKAEGERSLRNNKKRAIIRIGNVTQPIYDPSLDYVGKILYLHDKGKLYPLFHNQFLTLTTIPSLLEVIEKIILIKKGGIFHVACRNIFTPYEMGKYLVKKARGKTNAVRKIDINEYLKKIPNRYPVYGGLLSNKTSRKLKIRLSRWQESVDLFSHPRFKK